MNESFIFPSMIVLRLGAQPANSRLESWAITTWSNIYDELQLIGQLSKR